MVLDFILPIIHSQVGTPQISILNLGSSPERSVLYSTQHPGFIFNQRPNPMEMREFKFSFT